MRNAQFGLGFVLQLVALFTVTAMASTSSLAALAPAPVLAFSPNQIVGAITQLNGTTKALLPDYCDACTGPLSKQLKKAKKKAREGKSLLKDGRQQKAKKQFRRSRSKMRGYQSRLANVATDIPKRIVRPLDNQSAKVVVQLTKLIDRLPIQIDTDSPRVVSAISQSNTEILLQFSEPVQGADEVTNINIVSRDHGANLPVWDSLYYGTDQSTVQLRTLSQSSVAYVLTVANIRDLAGNPIADPTILVNPSRTTFVGTDPGSSQNVDSDGDGLPDHAELFGWNITIQNANGSVDARHVTSDPGDPRRHNLSAAIIAGANGIADTLATGDDEQLVARGVSGLSMYAPVVGPGVNGILETSLSGDDEIDTVNEDATDTDNEGVADNEEKHGGLDPRNPDSDGDTLTDNEEWNIIYSNPADQDTDGDGTQDGFEFYSYRTSPVLDDTDGDQISDTDEVLGRNRDPRIADLPLHGFDIGDVRLQIDERYTYEDTQGNTVTTDSSSNVTLTHGESSTRTISGKAFLEAMLTVKGGLEFTPPSPVPTKVEGGGEVQFKGGAEVQFSNESSVESQRVREESISMATELAASSTVTREIVGARIDADMTIANRGDLAFSISNLEITVLQRSRESTRRFVPVATLTPNSTIISGEPATFHLGPFTSEHGPILFSSRDVFPNLVDELMQSPSALVFEVANFDITDEFGRQFTFANQIARDRTGGIIIDYGDGQIERNLVATALQPDPDGFGGAADDFVGGFNRDGSPKGVPLDFALQDIMELIKNSTVVDGIVAGPNQMAESIAQGDDIQLIPPLTTGVSVGSIVVSAGQDGVLQSVPFGDDQEEVTTGYGTSLTCSADSTNAREICDENSDCTLGACTGPETLVRFGSQNTGDLDRQWVVLTTGNVPAGAEFGQLVLQPGEDFYFAFVQDLDQDGVFAREEFLSGSTDSSADNLMNGSFGVVGAQGPDRYDLLPPTAGSDDIPDSKDTDRDGLGDFAEIRVGWKVSADGGLLRQAFPSPRLADSDGDGLLDPQEQDLRSFCEPSDERADALCRWQNEDDVDPADAIAIIAGLDQVADTLAFGDDVQLVPQGVVGLTFATFVIGPGANGIIDTPKDPDDEYLSVESSTRIPPATDPVLSDTDVDGVDDFPELTGFLAGKSIRDGNTVTPPALPVAETLAIGDDVQQAFLGGPVFPGGIVVLPGENGIIDSTPGGDDVVNAGVSVKTDPLRRDTDTDLVSDGRELAQGGNPRDPDDGDEFRDSDQDGLSDSEESILGWLVSVNGGPASLVLSNPSRPDSDFDGLPDFAERVLGTDPNKPDTDGDGIRDFDEVADFQQFFGLDAQFPGFFVDGASSQQYGTDPNKSDTDSDTLSDYFELLEGYRVLLGGESTFRQVYTNPLVKDTDLDGADDNEEKNRALGATDATDPDTDDDGRSDGIEINPPSPAPVTDPLVPDVGITVTYKRLLLDKITDTGGDGGAEIHWFFLVKRPGDEGNGILLSTAGDCVSALPECGFRDPIPLGNQCYQFQADSTRYYSLPLGLARTNPSGGFHRAYQGQEKFALKEGESFSVNGVIFETDVVALLMPDCGVPPFYVPTWIQGGCTTRFDETFRYEDFENGGQASFPFPDGVDTAERCDWTVEVEVESN